MANCNKLFLDFIKEITPSFDQMQKMKTSREALEVKIVNKIKEKLGVTPTFYTQGSGSQRMKTIIIKSNGTYDSDRGVYLPKKPEEVSAEKVQEYVLEAVSDHTNKGASHRKKCIRVYYECEYNIDFPVYYEVDSETYSYLAIKGNGWIKDDPSQMISWFEARKDSQGQLIRIVKYLKAWASYCDFKMPSGIALTVWATIYYTQGEERDDKALSNLLLAMNSALSFNLYCGCPVEPYDDLTSKLTDDQKNKFQTELNKFCNDATKAINESNQLVASKIWIKYFGPRFKEGVDEDLEKKERALLASSGIILSGNGRLNSSGIINLEEGVKHKAHRNYGQ